jgi:hypothetical protein
LPAKKRLTAKKRLPAKKALDCKKKRLPAKKSVCLQFFFVPAILLKADVKAQRALL